MRAAVYESTYKDQKAVTLENDSMVVQFLPETGGKMASLVCRKTGREFLVQEPGSSYKVLAYDGCYVDAECSGFDDMFPTIDPCIYKEFPWVGTHLPDHGEVCGLTWAYEIGDVDIRMHTYGVRFPYRLEKRIGFAKDGSLKIEYQATNLSQFDMDFLWAAHPMINAEEGAEITLPYPENADITCVFTMDGGFGTYGFPMKWPSATRLDSNIQRLCTTLPRNESGNNYKFFFNERIPEGWFKYKYISDGTSLKLSFSEDAVPYFGIWVNEGSFHGHWNIAPEPCTGAYDRIDFAKAHGMNSVLKARENLRWFLCFEIIHE